MKARIALLLLAAALAAPVGARPLAAAPRAAVWVRAWHGFLDLIHGFRLFDASDASTHGLPPPTCSTTWLGQ
jgi:hypothetical protein